MLSSLRQVHRISARRYYSNKSISDLQAAFRNPSSPFYLARGTKGPNSPDAESENNAAGDVLQPREQTSNDAFGAAVTPQEEARTKLIDMGYDPQSFYEQNIVWGDCDSFRHVNNVRYVRFLESGRMVWLTNLALELGGPQRVRDMLAGKGVSLILKDISVKFRRPVTYPDTLLIAHRAHNPHLTHFGGAAAIWSYAQRAIVSTSDSTLVWYDYDSLKKCDPGKETRAILEKRILH